jgi:hypothetical protein
MRCSLTLFTLVVLSLCSACIDTPMPDIEPQARLVTAWDPLLCGEPHRVVIELEDERGADISRSVPCELGRLSLDLPMWGIYRGKVYAWDLVPNDTAEIRSVIVARLDIDAPIVHWYVDTPR